MLGDIRQRLGDDEIGDRFDGGRGPLRQLGLQIHPQPYGQRRTGREPRQRGIQPEFVQNGRMEAAHQVVEFLDRVLRLTVRGIDDLLRLGRDP